jgi:hypothetical protein
MADIDSSDIVTYDQWRERLHQRAVRPGWNIPAEVRVDVMERLVETIRNPETPFAAFAKAVDLLARLEKAERQAVSSAVNVTRWAMGETPDESDADGVLVKVPRWPGPFQDELDRLANQMEEFGIAKELADQVRHFELTDAPEPEGRESVQAIHRHTQGR